jgi:hypothetical protein
VDHGVRDVDCGVRDVDCGERHDVLHGEQHVGEQHVVEHDVDRDVRDVDL